MANYGQELVKENLQEIISEDDIDFLKERFDVVKEHTFVNDLVKELQSQNVLTSGQIENLSKETDETKKFDLLFSEVILQGTYQQLMECLNGFEAINQSALLYSVLKRNLQEPESDSNEDGNLVVPAGKGGSVKVQGEKNATSKLTNMIRNFGKKITKSTTDDVEVKPAGRKVIEQDEGEKTVLVQRSKSHTDVFLQYETKDPDSKYGKGLCLIIKLFTEDLTGYKVDGTNIQRFFHKMNYKIAEATDVTKEKLITFLNEQKEEIEREGTYDRLVVFIMTHGEEKGLKTCEADGLNDEKDADGKCVFTKVEEIVSCFKHDVAKSLKGMPKLFFIQACRGRNIVKHAGAVKQVPKKVKENNAQGLKFQRMSPVDADIAVCSSTTKNHPSFVSEHTGSWFVQKTLDTFEKHMATHHVLDMMTVVNLAVAENRLGTEGEDGKVQMAVQIPSITSSFRRQFYLCNQFVI